ncbi:MAG TPA: hypothetical protein VJR89_15320 [Polyangiales bacterium]|nr:hypothetical protein [Polyangiales bacterium]
MTSGTGGNGAAGAGGTGGAGGDIVESVELAVRKVGDSTGVVSSSPAGIYCGDTCSARFDRGSSVTLTAVPDACASFVAWEGSCGVPDGGSDSSSKQAPTCRVELDDDLEVAARFVPIDHVVAIEKQGDGVGMVTSVPYEITCDASQTTCSATVPCGTELTLSATSQTDSVFVGWSGSGCTGPGPCTVTVDGDLSVGAVFDAVRYKLEVSKSGSGTGTVISDPQGIDCGDTCSSRYRSGAMVTLRAVAESDASFAGWTGACAGFDLCRVTMSQDRTVTANFKQRFALEVSLGGTGEGAVRSSPAGIDCGVQCRAAYDAGQMVVLQQTPAIGSLFSAWSGDCHGGATCALSMSAERNVRAEFSRRGVIYWMNGSGLERLEASSLDQPAAINRTRIADLHGEFTSLSFPTCAWNVSDGNLYMVENGSTSLYRVDVESAAVALVGSHGIPGMRSLAYHPPTATLYGIARNSLYSLSYVTGTATLIGSTGLQSDPDGMAWDPVRARMTTAIVNLSNITVYAVDVGTGTATLIEMTTPGINGLGWTFDPTIDRLWAVEAGGNLYQYNPAVFNRTQIASGLAGGQFSCIAYVP